MPLYLPDFSEIMAVAETRGDASDAPHLWRGLVGAWPLQEPGGVTAFDVSGWGRSGTLSGFAATDRVVGTKGRMLDFDGTDASIAITPANSIAAPPFSFECWFVADTTKVLDLFGEEDTAGAFQLRTQNTSILAYVNGQERTQATYTVAAGTLYHLVYTRAANAVGASAIYVNGSSVSLSIDSGSTIAPLGTTWRIGARTASSSLWDGKIFNVAMYRRVLRPSEVKEKYADPWAMYRLRASVFAAAVAEPVLTYRNYILGGGVI